MPFVVKRSGTFTTLGAAARWPTSRDIRERRLPASEDSGWIRIVLVVSQVFVEVPLAWGTSEVTISLSRADGAIFHHQQVGNHKAHKPTLQ
jgi:hypothetical protein